MSDTTGTLTAGPITLEPYEDGGPGSLWGVNRHNGDAVFVVLETSAIPSEQATPWSAALWRCWEDSTHAPRDFGTPRYATREAALAAVRRMVAARG